MTEQEQRNYIKVMRDFTESEGWEAITEELLNIVDSCSDPQKIDGVEDLYFCRGRLSVARMMLSLSDDLDDLEDELNSGEETYH